MEKNKNINWFLHIYDSDYFVTAQCTDCVRCQIMSSITRWLHKVALEGDIKIASTWFHVQCMHSQGGPATLSFCLLCTEYILTLFDLKLPYATVLVMAIKTLSFITKWILFYLSPSPVLCPVHRLLMMTNETVQCAHLHWWHWVLHCITLCISNCEPFRYVMTFISVYLLKQKWHFYLVHSRCTGFYNH